MKGKKLDRTIVGLSLIVIVVLFVWFLKDILAPLFSMELKGNFDDAREMLESR